MSTLRDIKKPPAEVFNRYKVFRYLALTLSKSKRYQQSLPFYKLAEDFARGPSQECCLWTERARVYWSMGEMELARQDVNKALHVCPDTQDTKMTNAKLLFAEDKIEESLLASHIGFKQRRVFGKHISAGAGTIENTVGRKAGDMMSMDRLGKTIVKMKKKDLGYIEEKKLTQQEQFKDDQLFEKRMKCYSQMFLQENAVDKYFLMDCLNNKSIFASKNLETEELLKKIMSYAIDRVNKKQMSLWIRKPVYTQELGNVPTTQTILQENRDARGVKISLINNEAVRQLRSTTEQLQKEALVETYRKAMHFWHYLMSKNDNEMPNKRIFSECLYEIMGAMYLNCKKLQTNMTEAQNEARILFLLGVCKSYNVAFEVFKTHFHADIFNFKNFTDEMNEFMKMSTSPLEIAMISHELACAYSLQHLPEKARFYARICCYEAKKANSVNWYINGLFLLTRSELQEANMVEAKVILTAARDLTKLFTLKDNHDFIVRSIDIISRETEASLRGGASLAKREMQLLDLMATPELRSQIHQQLMYIHNLPAHLRLPLVPGVKTKKEKKQTHEDIPIEAKVKEEQIVQYKIMQRYTLQPESLTILNQGKKN